MDALAFGEPRVAWVPALDVRLAGAPAPLRRLPLDGGREIEQAALGVLQLHASLEYGQDACPREWRPQAIGRDRFQRSKGVACFLEAEFVRHCLTVAFAS